jgi:hypothetical protein
VFSAARGWPVPVRIFLCWLFAQVFLSFKSPISSACFLTQLSVPRVGFISAGSRSVWVSRAGVWSVFQSSNHRLDFRPGVQQLLRLVSNRRSNFSSSFQAGMAVFTIPAFSVRSSARAPRFCYILCCSSHTLAGSCRFPLLVLAVLSSGCRLGGLRPDLCFQCSPAGDLFFPVACCAA